MESSQTTNQPIPTILQPTEMLVNQETKPKKSKLTFILLGILIVLLFVVGVFFTSKFLNKTVVVLPSPTPSSAITNPTSTPDETANWKTYSDEILSFRYPSDWTTGEKLVFGSRLVVDFNYNLTPLFTLSEYTNYNNKTGEAYDSLNEFRQYPNTTKDIKVGAGFGIRITDAGDEGHVIPYEEVLTFTPNQKEIISLYYKKDYYHKPDSDKILDNILSTFEFLPSTGSEQVDETVDWKLIQNKEVGISFKYPDKIFSYTNSPQISSDYSYYGFNAFNNQEKRDHRLLQENDLELEINVWKPFKSSLEPYLAIVNAADNTTVIQPYAPGGTGDYTKVKTLSDKSGQKAIIYDEPEREIASYDGIVINDNKNVAVIHLMTGSHNKREELLPLLEQILSSFQFIK